MREEALTRLCCHLVSGITHATTVHPEPFHSAHEAYGIITEEYREFEAEVFRKEEERDRDRMLQELVHLLTTTARAIHDLGLLPEEESHVQ